MSEWKAPTDNPKYPDQISEMISDLKKVTEMLEGQIRKDEASIKRLELEMKKIEAQRKNGGNNG